MSKTSRDGPLLAVLLNPASETSGRRTLGAVLRAARVLAYPSYEVANLFTEATATVIELNLEVVNDVTWDETRERIAVQMRSAGGVLAAWGVAGAYGTLRRERDARAAWVVTEAARLGHDHMWMVGGEPRHPSRWHQYVADRNGRCSSGTFEERLGQVLTAVPLSNEGATTL